MIMYNQVFLSRFTLKVTANFFSGLVVLTNMEDNGVVQFFYER
jgi:hypothetical protein